MSADPADNASSANAEKTLAERALRLLREDILAGRLAPDARLKVAALQARYGLGISPLREALLRLSSEGLWSPKANADSPSPRYRWRNSKT